ncbi:MAG: TonB-dependent receptor [Bacteroidota bacterium]
MKKHFKKEVHDSFSLSRFLISLSLLLLVTHVVYGQGTIRGIITGADNGSTLPAATIVVKGTTTGTVSDYNGQYTLVLKAGSYTFQFSYMGYEASEETVTVEDNQITELNVALSPATIMGEEVVITAQARGQLAAVNHQLRSNKIVNVVSSERIRELPDANAAQAISRLPGVHLDGSKVVIRGIQPKMNKILINGVEMPSTEANNRATDLGMVSSNMLSGIEVFKTLTPDMDANAIGGVVNLRLREAPEGFHYSVTNQGTYNQQEKIMGRYKLWGDISNRFFNNRLGLAINLNYDTYRGGDDYIMAGYSLLEQGEIGEGTYMFSTLTVNDQINRTDNMGGSLVMDYKLPKGQLLFSSMLTHSTPENIRYNDVMNIGSFTRAFNLRHSRTQTLLMNNSLRYEQQIGIVKLDASVSNVSIDKEDEFRLDFRFHEFGAMPFYQDSVTNAKRLVMEPEEMYNYLRPDAWEQFRTQNGSLSPSDYNETQWLADLNLEVPLQISDKITASIKVGGKYKRMKRTYDRDYRSYYRSFIERIHTPIQDWLVSAGHEEWQAELFYKDFRDYDYKPNKGFMNNHPQYGMPQVIDVDMMDKMFLELLDPATLATVNGEAAYDYWGGENLYAGYVMGEIKLGSRLLIIPGVRYERVENNYTAPKVEQGTETSWFIRDTLNREAVHEHWLPHLHMRLQVTDWWDIRLSYNHTLSRPDYNYAIPSVYYNTIVGTGRAGNPNIAPAVSKNLDANFTFYSRKLGLISIGGFLKRIDDVFYSQPSILKNIPDSTIIAEFPIATYPSLASGTTNFYINNPHPAYIKGMEVEWQSNLSHLPSPFNGLVLNVNYTHVWSETKYMQHRVEKVFIPVMPFIEDVENDTFYVNRLLHQANDIGNISLGYDYKGFSTRVSFRFQGNVMSGISSRPEGNVYTNDVYKFDFVMKQHLPVRFADVEVFFNALNFTNVPYRQYHIYPNKGETNTFTRYSGRHFQLGIRLTH